MRRHALLIAMLALGGWLAPAAECRAQSKRPIADILADLKKGDNEKFKALQELETLGEKAAEAVPELIELLKNKNEDVRLGAALALGKVGPAAVKPLTMAVESADAGVRPKAPPRRCSRRSPTRRLTSAARRPTRWGASTPIRRRSRQPSWKR
jgi:hypothetical protein